MALNENALIRFHLFRIKYVRPFQQRMSSDNKASDELLSEGIRSRPDEETKPGNKWHIGNVRDIPDANALYFAIGRTTKSTIEKFDEKAKDFIEEPSETSPYTHCIVLTDLGVAAIAQKSRLAPTTQGVARRLESLLQRTDGVVRNGIEVEVRPIPDPQGFIAALRSAYALLSFTAAFRGPNPIDADEVFQKPLAQIASVTAASEGQVKLRGADLERDAVADIARSTAATGNTASARIRDHRGEKPRTVSMSGRPVELNLAADDASPSAVASVMRVRYQEVRENG